MADSTSHDTTHASDDVWETAFNDETRKILVEEDSFAWHSVTGLLLTIVSLGVLLASFAVVICIFTNY